MVQSIVARGGFDPCDFAARLADSCTRRHLVAPKWETYKAARNLVAGRGWHEAGLESTGNGAAQRAAPIGLFYGGRPDDLRKAAIRQAWITHRHPRAAAGSMIVAHLIAELVRGAAPSQGLVESLVEPVQKLDASFSQSLQTLLQWLDLPTEDAARQICSPVPAEPFSNTPEGLPPHVVPTVLWSIYALLMAPEDFTQALMLALYPGGDVATTANIVGALSGASLGLARLPEGPCTLLWNGSLQVFDYLVELSKASCEFANRATHWGANSLQ
jgi:ADP-ribosylglycohydrolase